MALRFGSAVARTVSSFVRARTRNYVTGNESDVSQSALDHEISFAARADVSVLVTGDTLAAARRVACALQERLQPSRMPVAVNCAVAGDSLVELLDTHTGSIVLEDVGSLGDQTQALLLGFLENRLGSPSGDAEHVRIISTALTDLYSCVKAGTFREALFYRLNVIHISVCCHQSIRGYNQYGSGLEATQGRLRESHEPL
jgi:DNA-binding NtrC family response regulator